MLKDALVPVEEQPYEVPANWTWVKLGHLCEITTGKLDVNAAVEDGEYPFFTCAKKIYSIDQYSFDTEAILIAGNGDFNVKFYKGKFNAYQRTYVLYNFKSEVRYVYLYILLTLDILTQNNRGSTIKYIRLGDLTNHLVPVPPLNEQKRISDKVERLLEKINQAKQLIEEARSTFELRRAAILDKAFRGELTKKWRDEHRSEILDFVSHYQLIKSDRLENVESSRELKEVSQMFEEFKLENSIDTNGWLHLKANMFCLNVNCGRTPSEDISDTGEIPFLKVYNIVNNKIDFEYKPQFIPKEVNDQSLGKSKLFPNDVIMNIVGPPLKKIAIIPDDYPMWNMNQAIVRFRPLQYILPKFLYYCLQYDETLKEVINETRGVVGQSNISVSQSRNLMMPVPSLGEQKVIINVLENLIEKEDDAINNLNAQDAVLERLKQSILSKAFTGMLGTGSKDDGSALD